MFMPDNTLLIHTRFAERVSFQYMTMNLAFSPAAPSTGTAGGIKIEEFYVYL